MFNFCTYFDSNYILKGIALYRSLMRHAFPFRLWVLCLDDTTWQILRDLALPEIVPISLSDFERNDTGLLNVKKDRSRFEYYFTCTPSLPLYIFKNYSEVGLITYLDSDLFFFSGPSSIFQEMQDASVLIIEHRFSPHLKDLEEYGTYNVSFTSFRKDKVGLSCLEWWREKCLEWCCDRPADGKFADQKYLDSWPSRFSSVKILNNKGANLAPWNIAGYHICLRNNRIFVDSDPLIFFHFNSFYKINKWLYYTGLSRYHARNTSIIKKYIFSPYIRELHDTRRWLSSRIKYFNNYHTFSRINSPLSNNVRGNIARLINRDILITIHDRVI